MNALDRSRDHPGPLFFAIALCVFVSVISSCCLPISRRTYILRVVPVR